MESGRIALEATLEPLGLRLVHARSGHPNDCRHNDDDERDHPDTQIPANPGKDAERPFQNASPMPNEMLIGSPKRLPGVTSARSVRFCNPGKRYATSKRIGPTGVS